MKRVLLVQYSQSGQLYNIARQFTAPLEEDDSVELVIETLQPETDYPFPWPFFQFLDTFPESVYLDPPALKPLQVNTDQPFDLIILAYQVWFLSPSLPTTAFLKSDAATKLLKDTPVVTLIGCRNMWLMAQEQVKILLQQKQAKLVGNVALVDEAGSLGSFLATPVWVLSGKKGPHLKGLIPRAGVSAQHIQACRRFGERILAALKSASVIDQQLLQNLGAVDVNEGLISSEKTARRGFLIWGKLLRSLGPQGSWKRKPVLLIYVCFLITFILTFVPLSMLLKRILAPLTRQRIAEQKRYFGQPSGN